MNINNIYLATEGEGIHLGKVQIFIRFQGCDCGCSNCDSAETWTFDPKFCISEEKVFSKIQQLAANGVKRLSITGGEPLHPKNIDDVRKIIKTFKKDFFINLETSGCYIDKYIFDNVSFISFDVKPPSTEIKTPLKNILFLIENYLGKFQIKSPISNKKDFDTIHEIYQNMENKYGPIPWVLTPAYNANHKLPRKRFQEIMSWNMQSRGSFRIIGQQHKWAYGPTAKCV